MPTSSGARAEDRDRVIADALGEIVREGLKSKGDEGDDPPLVEVRINRSGANLARDWAAALETIKARPAEHPGRRAGRDRLRMAERTAENHVTHILTKLGFDSRARVAAWYTARRHTD